jgi:hypothetical protein
VPNPSRRASQRRPTAPPELSYPKYFNVVRSPGRSRASALRPKRSSIDLRFEGSGNGSYLTQCMVRPCVARRFRRSRGERSCINASGLYLERFWTPGHHGYQRECELISGLASRGHLGHQCSHAPGRPNLHFVSSSLRPRLDRNLSWLGHGQLLGHVVPFQVREWSWPRPSARWRY